MDYTNCDARHGDYGTYCGGVRDESCDGDVQTHRDVHDVHGVHDVRDVRDGRESFFLYSTVLF